VIFPTSLVFRPVRFGSGLKPPSGQCRLLRSSFHLSETR